MTVRLVMPSALTPPSMVLTGGVGGSALTLQVSDGSLSAVSTADLILPCLDTWMSIQYRPSCQWPMPKSAGVARRSSWVSPELAKAIGLLTVWGATYPFFWPS